MTVFLGICAVLACLAWLAAEGRITEAELRHADLRRRYARLLSENHTMRAMLGDAIRAMPPPHRGRKPGEPLRYQNWPDDHKQRLERHLQLVDRRTP